MGDSVWNDFLDETIEERYELVAERVEEISKEALVPELYKGYFTEAAVYLKKTMELCQMAKDGTLQQRSLETCKADQEQLYHHMLPAYYEESYANPAYAVAIFGEKEGELLSFLRAELDVAITYAFEGKLAELTLLLELFVQVYNCFEEEDVQEAKQTIYWYFHDYSEVFVEMMTVGALSGLGRTRLCSVISIAFTSLRIPLAIILSSSVLGILGIWWALTTTTMMKGMIFTCVFLLIVRKMTDTKIK